MSSRRTLILVASLAVGAIAAFLVFNYVSGVEKRAEGDQQEKPVLVAATGFVKGTSATKLVEAGGLKLEDRRIAELPTNAVTRPEDIKGQNALVDISPGTIITTSMFANPGASADSNAGTVRDGMVLVTTSSDSVRSVANLINVGDYVNLTYMGKCLDSGLILKEGATVGGEGDNADPNAAGANEGTDCAASLYQKVRIHAIGQDLGTPVAEGADSTETTGQDLITFEVPPEAAQVISFVGPGSLYLTLVGPEYEPIPLEPTFTPFPAAGVFGDTPYGGDPEAAEKEQ